MQRPGERLSREEQQFVERLREHYAPVSRSAWQRAAFRIGLTERMSRAWLPTWKPLVAVTCAGVVALWFVLSSRPGGEDVASTPGTSQGADVIVAFAVSDEDLAERGDLLPEDYVTLTEVFDL